jgi:PAS domain S-box-containing protein
MNGNVSPEISAIESLLAGLTESAAIIDSDDRIVTWNHGFAELVRGRFALTPRCPTKGLLSSLQADKTATLAIRADYEAWLSGKDGDGLKAPRAYQRVRIISPEGKEHYLSVSFSPFSVGGGCFLAVFLYDETAIENQGQIQRDTERKLSCVFEDSMQTFWEYDIQTRRSKTTEGWAKRFKLGTDDCPEYASDDYLARIHPDDRGQFEQCFMRHTDSGEKAFVAEYRLKDSEGNWRWILDHGWISERDKDGNAIRAIGASSDITTRKELENSITEKNRMLRAVLDQSPQQIYARDAHGRFFLANRAVADFYKSSPTDLLGADFRAIHPDQVEAESLLADELHVIKTGETVLIPERRVTNAARKATSLDLTIVPFDVPGVPERMALSFGVDITEKVNAERTLSEERDRLAVTLRSLGEGVIATDTAGKILLMNPVAEEITGWDEREAIGKPVNVVLKIRRGRDLPSSIDVVCEIVSERKVVSGTADTYLEKRDGSLREISDRGAPIIGEDGLVSGAVLVISDVTERRALEREIQRIQKVESLGILAGGIAHDFNNILMAVLGNISLARLNLREEDENWNILSEAEKAVLQAKRLTSQLSLLAKGGAEPTREQVDLDRLLEEACTINLRGSNVTFQKSIAPDLGSVMADEAQLMQVFQNLIINARESMPTGGKITVSATNLTLPQAGNTLPLKLGRYVKIDVSDCGGGVSPEIAQRIFDPYFSTKSRGSGLGLTVSFSVIQKHRGLLTLSSCPGKGSTFSVYLPAS